MEITKRDVDELNELAEKITGTNPKAKTTAQVLNYIEQNYQGNTQPVVNALPDNFIIITGDNATISEDVGDTGASFIITNKKLHDALISENDPITGDSINCGNIKIMFVNTGKYLDAYSVSFNEQRLDEKSMGMDFHTAIGSLEHDTFIAVDDTDDVLFYVSSMYDYEYNEEA